MQDDITKVLQELIIKTDKINKRLTVVAFTAILTIASIMVIYCIRDACISESYFNQSVIQESSEKGLKQEFKGGK